MPADLSNTKEAPTARRRATRTGVVVSNKMDKTVVVAVARRVAHPSYGRVVSRTSKFYAHDPQNTCKVGDVVTIVESRPLSRLKRWRVRSILREGKAILREIAGPEVAADSGRPAPKRRHRDSERAAGTGETDGEE